MYNYDIMDNRGVILSERSLYAQRPIISSDLIDFGWVSSDEILVIDENNYQNCNEIKHWIKKIDKINFCALFSNIKNRSCKPNQAG